MSDTVRVLMNRIIDEKLSSGDILYVSHDEMAEAIFEANTLDPYPVKPKPPIKSFSHTYGFWSGGDSVEYDNRAPEYLKQLEIYEERIESWKKRNKLKRDVHLIGPNGPVKLEIKKD